MGREGVSSTTADMLRVKHRGRVLTTSPVLGSSVCVSADTRASTAREYACSTTVDPARERRHP
jgi:hypothetical protein